jgi:hypothetical protein
MLRLNRNNPIPRGRFCLGQQSPQQFFNNFALERCCLKDAGILIAGERRAASLSWKVVCN